MKTNSWTTAGQAKDISSSPNLTLNELSISSLQNDETIIIKEADKGRGGGVIVIMNRDYYKRKVLEMLEDNAFYKEANNDCSKTTFKNIKSLIKP